MWGRTAENQMENATGNEMASKRLWGRIGLKGLSHVCAVK